jgi:hypothetical protein
LIALKEDLLKRNLSLQMKNISKTAIFLKSDWRLSKYVDALGQTTPPHFRPSINVRSLDLFLQFKTKPPGYAMLNHLGDPLLDVVTKLKLELKVDGMLPST